jgi:BirA family biotin operon repressor/biotin-[acetyl-CoA-carboxylase] ligase
VDESLLSLPPAYTLHHEPSTADVVADAAERGRAGEPEGTLFWAERETRSRGSGERCWDSPSGNLHCAVIVRPDYGNDEAGQLFHVAGVAAAAAVALAAAPMMPLGWLVIGFRLHVVEAPAGECSLAALGAPEATATEVLESFARHFLSFADQWARGGLPALERPWRQRSAGLGGPCTLATAGEPVTGIYRGLDDDGAVLLEVAGGTHRPVPVLTCTDITKAY